MRYTNRRLPLPLPIRRPIRMTIDVSVLKVLEMTGYSVTDGADYRLFAVLAAMSYRVTSLE